MVIPLLCGPRVVLRSFLPHDAAPFAAYRSDPEIGRFQGWESGYTLADARSFVAEQVRDGVRLERGEWSQLAIASITDDRLLGDVALRPDEDQPGSIELGYTLATAAQHRGLATEAVGVALTWQFTVAGAHRAHARADARNRASIRVLERLGFRDEGTAIEALWIPTTCGHPSAGSGGRGSLGEWGDERRFGLLAREWRLRPAP